MKDNYSEKNGIVKYIVNSKLGKTAVAGATGLALLASTGCATIGTVNGVPISQSQSTEKSGNSITNFVKEHPYWSIAIGAGVAGAIYAATQNSGSSSSYTAPAKKDKPVSGGDI